MIGSILGDYLGSIYEEIPGKELRVEKTITDDSWLTFSQLEWLNSLDLDKFRFLFKKNTAYKTKEFSSFDTEIFNSAKKYLSKWVEIGIKNSKDEFPFSVNMKAWSDAQKVGNTFNSSGTTNGCLMRNSALPWFSVKNKLTLLEALYLAQIFAKTTHNSDEALEAVMYHTFFSYMAYSGLINKENYRDSIKDLRVILEKEPVVECITKKINIQPAKYWLGEKVEKKFIWDAQTSLDIAMSAVFYAESYDDFIAFCNKIGMDADTYGAIGGDIAYKIFGSLVDLEFKEYLFSYKEIKDILNKNKVC